MLDYDKALSTARPGRAFSNGTEWEIWSGRWCDDCANDINEDCPLIALAMFGEVTPAEWVEIEPLSRERRYECIEFIPREEAS